MTTEAFPHVTPWSEWTDDQRGLVRKLMIQLAKAETTLDRVRDLADDLEEVAREYNAVPNETHDAGARNAHFAVARRIRHALDPEEEE